MYLKSSLLIVLLAFTGCSNSVIQSTMDLNNEFEVKVGYTGAPNQLKQFSINGLSPITNVGEFYFIRPRNGLQSAVMLNGSDFVSSPNDFFVQRTTYRSIAEKQELFEIKNLINKLERLSTKILEEKIKELKVESEKVYIKQKIEDINKQISKTFNNDVTKLEEQKKEKKEEIINVDKSVSLEHTLEIKNQFKEQLKIEEAIAKLKKELADENISAELKKEKEEKKKVEEKKLSDIKTKITTLFEVYGKSIYQLQYDLLYEQYLEKTSKENIFVFRWKMKTDNNSNADANEYATIDSKNKKERSGYLIASGVTIEKLVPNKTFIEYLESKANTSNYSSILRGHLGMVTYTLKVDHLVSFVSQKKENMFKLLASLKDVQHFSSDIKKLTNVELGISLLGVSDVSTFSNFSEPYHQKIKGKTLYDFKTVDEVKNEKKVIDGLISAGVVGIEKSISRIKNVNLLENDNTSIKSNPSIKPNQTTIFSVITEATELADMYE